MSAYTGRMIYNDATYRPDGYKNMGFSVAVYRAMFNGSPTIDAEALRRSMHSSRAQPAKHTHADKVAQARARHGKPFACDPGSTFRFRRDRTILDDWLDTLREQRAAAQAEVPGLLREQAV